MNTELINSINPYVLKCGYIGRTNCPPPGTPYSERKVKWYEMELILWGEGHIYTEGEKIPARKGEVFFRKPGMTVQGVSPYYCYIIIFDMFYNTARQDSYSDPQYYNGTLPGTGDMNSDEAVMTYGGLGLPHVLTLTGEDFIEYETLFSNTYKEFLNYENQNRFFLKANVLQILLKAYRQLAAGSLQIRTSRSYRSNYTAVMKVKQYMDTHFNETIRLEDLGRMSALSPNFLCKIFREIVGEAPVTYLNRLRINHAKKLLIETGKEAKKIAYLCGFENETYFFTLFRKMTGTTPLTFREMHRFPYV